ncbi:MAG: MATE family efflux transporter [Candidatus Cloacimonetes bacterium]|nr:MATE family efflux transporter [Candidatus Cloacimonadota bacterium]
MKRSDVDLTRGNILKNLIGLSFPIMISNFLQMFYNLTDTFWLGKLGERARDAVSVTGLTFPLIFFISSFGFGFVVAGTSLIAQYKGAVQLEKAREVVGQFLIILTVFCLIFISISFIFIDEILSILRTPAEILEISKAYISIILSGMIFMFIFLSYQSFAHGLGDTVSPMKIQIVSVGLNVIMDPLLIFGWGIFPRLEITGAAYATIFSRFVAASLAIYYLLRRSPQIVPKLKHLKPRREIIAKIMNISIPASLSQSITSFGFIILQGFVNSYGTLVISVFSIGNRLTGFFMMPAMGISNALASIIGQNLGARKIRRAEQSVKVAFLFVMSIMLVGCLVVFLYGSQLTRFFIDDPQVSEVGRRMFKITSIASLVFAVGFIFMGVFNGSGHTKSTLIFNVSRLWLFRIPLVFILSGQILNFAFSHNTIFHKYFKILAEPLSDHPYDALWWSMLISNILAGTWAFILYRRGKWKKAKIHS